MKVTDLTNVNNFTVPSDAISFVLQTFSDPNIRVGFWKLAHSSSGKDLGLGTSSNSFIWSDEGYGNVLVPITPDFSATAGEWTFRPSGGFTSIKLTLRTGTLPSASVLRIKPYLTGTIYSPADVEAAMAVVKKIYEDVGLQVFIDSVTVISGSQYTNVSSNFNNARTAALVSQGSPDWINLFFVEDLSGGGAGFSLLGVSAGIPGSLGVAGRRNGVLNGMAAHVRGGVLNTQFLGETAAHEMGHWLGLFHTTERSGLHDPLTDTPECPGIGRGPSQCLGYDGANLMFWVGDGVNKQITLSAQQTRIINYSPMAQ